MNRSLLRAVRASLHWPRTMFVAVALVGLWSAPIFGVCTATIGNFTRLENELRVTATASGGQCGDTRIAIQYESSAGADWNCPNSNTCAHEFGQWVPCLAPGDYTFTATAYCSKLVGQDCVGDTPGVTQSTYTQPPRGLSGSYTYFPWPPDSPNPQYRFHGSWNIPNTLYSCRSLSVRLSSNDAFVSGFNTDLGTSGESEGGGAISPECGLDVYGLLTAVVPEETVRLPDKTLPPHIPDRAGQTDAPQPSTDCVSEHNSCQMEPDPPTGILPGISGSGLSISGSFAESTGEGCSKCAPKASSPINLGSGNVDLTIPLFSISGPTFPLSLTLTYHSAPVRFRSRQFEMGIGWYHSFGGQLVQLGDSPTYLYYVDGSGSEQIFKQTSAGPWIAARPVGSADKVTSNGTGHRLQRADGSYRLFDSSGRWTESGDRWGNSVAANYDGSGNLTSVVDPLGRTITIIANGRQLQKITLPGGAVWEFTYTGSNLTAIYDPAHPYNPADPRPWRTFSYIGDSTSKRSLLTEMRDDASALLESHAYDAQDRGISSVTGSGRDQVTVQYDVPSVGMRRVTHSIDGTQTQVTDLAVGIVDGRYAATSMTGTRNLQPERRDVPIQRHRLPDQRYR